MTRFSGVLWIGLLCLMVYGCASDSSREVVICSFGGSFQAAQREAFFDPYTRATGIRVQEVTYTGDYAQLRAMVASGNVTWDVVDVELATLLAGAQEGLFEKIDWEGLPEGLMKEAIHAHGIATDFYSTGIAHRRSATQHAPKSWQQFWDVERFPGERALRRNPYTLLEMALLADGVGGDDLYPLDIDRAFVSLGRIKNFVKVWWTTGQQPVQLLASGEVEFSSAWSGRIWNAAHKDKIELVFDFDGALLEPEWWVILKGAPHKGNAREFIRFASMAEPQARMAEIFGVGPVNINAFDHIAADVALELPTSARNLRRQIYINGYWWAENLEAVTARWERWILE